MEILVSRKDIQCKAPDGSMRTVPALLAGYENQEQFLKKLPRDCIITIKTKVARNLKLHRQTWAVINFAYDNLPAGYEFKSINIFVDWLKLTVGYTETYKIAGQVRLAPKSISFAQCDENQFRQDFYIPATELMADIIGIKGEHGFTPAEQLIENSKEYKGIDYRLTPYRR